MSLARIPRSHRASFIPLPLSGLRARRIRNSDRTPSRRAVDVSAVEAAAEGGSWTDLLAILALSAAPFVIVQALADSDRGKVLQEKLAAEMVQLKKDSAQWTKDRVAARRDSRWFGADRPKFLGPLGFDYPEHLRGELPGYVVRERISDRSSFNSKLSLYFPYSSPRVRNACMHAIQ